MFTRARSPSLWDHLADVFLFKHPTCLIKHLRLDKAKGFGDFVSIELFVRSFVREMKPKVSIVVDPERNWTGLGGRGDSNSALKRGPFWLGDSRNPWISFYGMYCLSKWWVFVKDVRRSTQGRIIVPKVDQFSMKLGCHWQCHPSALDSDKEL